MVKVHQKPFCDADNTLFGSFQILRGACELLVYHPSWFLVNFSHMAGLFAHVLAPFFPGYQ